MGVFDRQIESAKKLIVKNGQEVIWKRTYQHIANQDEPWKESKGARVEYKVMMAFLPVDYKNQQFKRYRFETDIEVGTIAGYMGQVDFEPSLRDVVIRDGKTYVIKNIDPIDPNGQGVILYVIELMP